MRRIRVVLVASAVVVGTAVGYGLFRKFRAPARDAAAWAMFGEATTKVLSGRLSRADATAVFGASTLDLRDAEIDAEADIDAVALFGGVEVLLPARWRLALSGTSVFGGVEDLSGSADRLPADAARLNLHAVAVFGGVTVANEPGAAARRKAAVSGRGADSEVVAPA
ncbi:hypothetical protein ACIBL3_21625 [Kribbella sp. NPDC050124]|uniref:hypothetical protein n=1 Tax=Kribbella sp. NPDC050124 TaxID=3364114 RepID=UPI0037B614A3